MTKQEEIKRVLTKELDDLQNKTYNPEYAAEWILGMLDTVGVVIKVDRESGYEYICGARLSDIIKAGYAAVEKLIDGEKE